MWTVAAKTTDLKPNTPHQVHLQGLSLALFLIDGQVYATDSTCPHKQGPLGLGYLDGKTIYCPLHGWAFEITTGICREHPEKPISCYPARVVGDEIEIDLP